MEYIAIGKAEGAELVTGGKMCRRDGFFVEPTLFADVKSHMRITKEEIFGPVLVVTPFDDIDEVVKAANDTRYGLAAGIFTSDLNKCHYLASRIEAGNIWVNCYGVMHPAMPFGGYKESGWGREAGAEGLDAFLEKKAVVIQLKI
jgi:acyl-CoA reductase-like NAD-dependent aldehyde dehydrogenase